MLTEDAHKGCSQRIGPTWEPQTWTPGQSQRMLTEDAHKGCSTCSWPTCRVSMPTASNQGIPDVTLLPLEGFPMSLPAFKFLPNTSDGGCPPCYRKLWINSLFLVSCGWTHWFPQLSWISHQTQWALPKSADPSLGPRDSWEDREAPSILLCTACQVHTYMVSQL